MHAIYLARLDYEQDGFAASAVRGIRSIWTGLGIEHTFGDAKKLVDLLISAPTQMVLVVQGADYQQLHDAMVKSAEAHQGAAEFVLDPEDTTMPSLEEEEEDAGVFSAASFKTALILVNIGPNPLTAVGHALALARASEDVGLYQEVINIIAETFNLPVTMSHGDNGPEITIYGEGNPNQVEGE